MSNEKIIIVHEQKGLVKQGCGCLSVWIGFQVMGVLFVIGLIIVLGYVALQVPLN